MRNKQQIPNIGRVCNMKRRKGKCTVALTRDLNPEVKSTEKNSVKKMDVKKTKIEDSKTEMLLNDLIVGGCTDSLISSERLCCNLHDKTSSGAPPELEELWDGKENGVKLELNYYGTNRWPEKLDNETQESVVVTDKSIFLDDDSNHVLPVEKFFGNMEVVQDCPRRSTATSTFSRREHRRRLYYAKEDSDEEIHADMGQNSRGGTLV
ncbi:hypothetical protein UPYG_G00008540 [Umbra pygmaea]|uniref:Uncharacterized protein n=1 Tax=Umbra pygmaea TaxID=75934 RepID=A0ABD0XI15_UMBPY